MNFYAPENFLFLWVLPVAAGLFWISGRFWKRRLSKLGSFVILRNKLMPAYHAGENTKRLILILLALFFSVCALARPQWGEEKLKIQRKGVDVIFLLDTSLSMLAEDLKPSRFEKSKTEIRSILQKLKGDRVGMVAFAGSSFLQSPLTLDYSAFRLFLDAIKVGYIPDPGTSLNQALSLAMKSFPEKENKHRAVILFTDGEDHEGGMDPVLEEAKKIGLRVYTVGVGTAQGEPIPLWDENRRKTGFKKDRAGQVVITKLNQELLEKIAKETGAIYLPSTPGEDEVEILLNHMQSLGKRDYNEKMIAEREDHYQLFLTLSLFFLLLEMFLRRTKKIAALVLLGFLTLSSSSAFAAEDPMKLYENKKYQSAKDAYQKEKTKNPEDAAVRYNLGTTLYQLDQFHDSAQELEKTSKEVQDPKLKAKALYNYGNAQYRLGNFEKAIESYQKALELNPQDKDSKYNLEFIQKQKSLFDKKDSERKNDKNKNQQQQQQQNQNNQQQNQQNQQQNKQDQQKDQQQQNQQNQQQNQQQNNQEQNQQQNQSQGQQNSEDQKNQPEQDPKQDQQEPQDSESKQDPQDKKDQQQKQDQNPQQNPDQKDSQKQDKPKEDRKENQEPRDQGEKPEDKEGEEEQQKEKKPEPGESEKEPNQPDEPEPKDQGQEPQEAREKPQEESEQPQPGEEQEAQEQPQKPGGQAKGGRPLQGQMTMENAMQILEALKEGEKDLQDLRRPVHRDGKISQPVKDW